MSHPALAAGRTAVVTGAASGIGRATATALAARRMAVALIDLPGPALDSAAAALEAAGAEVLALPADVADRAALEAAKSRIAAELPPVTLVMNNAGVSEPSSCLGGPEPFERILAVNLWGVIHGAQVFAPLVLAHGEPGAIVNTGSKQGITTPPGNPAYNVSKSAVRTFTEALEHELRNRPGCRVSAHLLIPGWVHTGITSRQGQPKPDGAWTADQTAGFFLESLERGDFYILCPDNQTPRTLDEKRMAWAMGDIIENRPALSRWHLDWAQAFADHVKGG
jgi:NAD(P)-dependent dehydrogenase (short-subunit alcohol dehydrogenase family)